MNDRDIEDTRQPKDEPEAEYCESCGQEMEFHNPSLIDPDPYFECNNQFCPEKFEKYDGVEAVVKDMSERLAEVEQELADTKNDLKYANARITNLKTRLERAEKLTQSQQGEE